MMVVNIRSCGRRPKWLPAVRVRYAGVAMVLLAAVFAPNSPARASIWYQPFFGQGYATQSEVRDALGNLTFTITDCRNDAIGLPHRSVGVQSSDYGYEDRRVVETVLYWAALYAWRQCPLHVSFAMTRVLPQFRFEITSVELHLPDGSVAVRAGGLMPIMGAYSWSSIEDIGFARRHAEAQQAAQRAQAQQQAQAWAAYQGRRAADSAAFWAGAKRWAIWVGIVLAVLWLISKREPILRWYYFAFHPHPAEPMVRSALKRGRQVDGAALAAVLGDLPPRNGILRSVRIAQGEQLVAKMRSATESTIKRNFERARTDYERATFHGVQEAVALAAVALERAKAAQAASKSI